MKKPERVTVNMEVALKAKIVAETERERISESQAAERILHAHYFPEGLVEEPAAAYTVQKKRNRFPHTKSGGEFTASA